MAQQRGAVVLVRGRREWPSELVARIAREGFTVIGVDDVRLVPFFVLTSHVAAVLVDLDALDLLGEVALRRCRDVSPSTSIVVVSHQATPPFFKRALESGATAFLSWPAVPDVVAQILRGRSSSETTPASDE